MLGGRGRGERRGEYMRHKTKDKACGKDQPSRQGQLEKKERGRVKVMRGARRGARERGEVGGVVWVKGGDSYSKDTRRTSERLWGEGGNRTSTPKKQQYLPNETERRTTRTRAGKKLLCGLQCL